MSGTPPWTLLLTLSLLALGCAEKAVAAPEAAEPLPTSAPTVLASPPTRAPEAPPTWPSASAPLTVARVEFPRGFGRRRIYLDAGHGAQGNEGNSSVVCAPEASFTLRVAQELARRLEATGHFGRTLEAFAAAVAQGLVDVLKAPQAVTTR